jgi:hypothetical protein
MEIFSSLHLTGRRIALLVVGCVVAAVLAVAFVSTKGDVYEEDAVVFLGQFLGDATAENTFAVEQQAADFQVALKLPEVLEQTATVAGIDPHEVRDGLESERDLVGTSVVVRFQHADPAIARNVVTTAPRIALQTLAQQQLSVAEAKEETEQDAVEGAEDALLEFRAATGTFDLEAEVVTRSAELREIELERARAASAATDVRSGLVTELNRLYEQRSQEFQNLFAQVPQYQALVRDLEDARVRYDEARDARARAEARSAGASASAVIVDDVTSVVPRTSEYVRAALSAIIAVVALGLLGFALAEVLSTRRRGVTRPTPAPAAAAEPVAEPAGTVTTPAAAGDELVDTAARVDPVRVRSDKADNGGARRPPQPRPRRRTPTPSPK